MTKQPLISVLLLTYNQENTIAQAINSILEQECDFIYELIISDDCSTDNTPIICQKFANKHRQIRFIQNVQNKGVLKNYIDTLLLAKGKYIADCAGDDYWIDSKKLQRQAYILSYHPSLSLTFTNYKQYLVNEARYIEDVYRHYQKDIGPILTYDKDIYSMINQEKIPLVFLGTACFVKDSFLKAYKKYNSFFTQKKYPCEDFQILFFLLFEGSFFYEKNITTVYRIDSHSVSNSNKLDKTLDFAFRSFILKTDIIIKMRLDLKQCIPFMDSRIQQLLSLCIRLHNKIIYKQLIQRIKEMKYPLNNRFKLYRFLFSFSFFRSLFKTYHHYKKSDSSSF